MRLFEYETLNEMSFDVAKTIFNFYNYYIKKQNYFTLVLSGGNTPKILYQILSSEYKNKINWSNVYIFLGDERYTTDKKYINYEMIYETLISKIDINPENVFRIHTNINPIEECAKKYEKNIMDFFKNKEISFDLILLGMGDDGHTASIFPDTIVSDDKYIDYVYPKHAKPKVPRITFTYKTINNSKNVIFIISGEKKIKIFREILKGKEYPAGKVNPKENLLYFISKN
ncbi:6-phosphogluconolactonase [Marinitoga arctica]